MSAPMPNPFDPDSTVYSPRTVEEVVASRPDASTEPAAINSCQEPVAADCIAETCENLKFVYECTDGTMFHRCATCGRKAYLNATNDIPEIFRVAHQLCAGARQFVPDHHAIWDAMHDPGSPRALESDLVWADEAPLFLRMAI